MKRLLKLLAGFARPTVRELLRALAVASLVLVPLSFIFGGVLSGLLERALAVRVDPSYAGGPLLAEIIDPVGDDAGGGSLEYPLHPALAGGGLADLVAYEIYRPMTGAAWSNPEDFWQLGLAFARLDNPRDLASGFSGLRCAVYIDLDGPSGSTETALQDAELVRFPPENAWDLAVLIDGDLPGGAVLVLPNGEERRIACFVSAAQGRIHVRLPLDIPQVQPILDGRASRHWIFCGLADPLAEGGFMAVRALPGLRSGGGAVSPETSRVYDLIASAEHSQAEQLAPPVEGGLSVIQPLVAPGFDPLVSYRSSGAQARLDTSQIVLEELKQLAETEAQEERSAASARLEAELAGSDERKRALALFNLGRFDEAERLISRLGELAPEDAELLAYAGSLLAMQGGKVSPAQAVSLVTRAMEQLDQAVALARQALENPASQAAESVLPAGASGVGPDRDRAVYIACLYNRANVAAAVPNEVFNTLPQAVEDYLTLAGLFSVSGDNRQAARCLAQAAQGLERLNQRSDARLAWLKALAVSDRPASVSLELARRGLLRNGL